MKKYISLILAGLLMFTAAGCGSEAQAETDTEATGEYVNLQAQMPEEGEEIAVIDTSKGVVKMRFFPEEAPKAVENFKTLAKDGYYDGLTFHRVIEDFMIQTGDPTGTGTGGESCWGEDFEDEVSPNLHFYNGAVAMAKSFTANAPIAVKYAKACIDRGMQMDIDDGIALENELFAMCFATADQKEGMSAFLEKRKEKHFQNK